MALLSASRLHSFELPCFVLLLCTASITVACAAEKPNRALGADPAFPRSLSENRRHVFLTGAYPAIGSFVDTDVVGGGAFDWKLFLDTISGGGVNYARQVFSMGYQPRDNPRALVPWLRTGPGAAQDGRPKYNLDKFDPRIFDRFLDIAQYARQKGVYLQIVLFDCWDIKADILDGGQGGWGWRYHAFNGANNVQRLDVTVGGDGSHGFTDHTNARLMHCQKAMAHKLADTLKNEPNVVFEIANENYYDAAWEKALADDLTAYEKRRGYLVHLVMPRDLPNHETGELERFTAAHIRAAMPTQLALGQPIINDSDGAGMPSRDTVRHWAWISFMSGASVSYLDESWNSWMGNRDATGAARRDTRADLGRLRKFVASFSWWRMTPLPAFTPQNTCFATGEKEKHYLLYSVSGPDITLSGLTANQQYRGRWYDPRQGTFTTEFTLTASSPLKLTKPTAQDWALDLRPASEP